MKSLTNYLVDVRFRVGSWIVPRTVYGAVLESSLDAAFADIEKLKGELSAKKSRSTSAK